MMDCYYYYFPGPLPKPANVLYMEPIEPILIKYACITLLIFLVSKSLFNYIRLNINSFDSLSREYHKKRDLDSILGIARAKIRSAF